MCALGGTLVCLDRQRRRIISQSSSGCILPPFNQADDGSRNEVLPRLFASEINIQRMLQDAGDTNDAFYWRDKRGLEVEQEKFEELSSCWKNSRQPSNYSPEPLHRVEMNLVNINKRFPPWNMTGSFFPTQIYCLSIIWGSIREKSALLRRPEHRTMFHFNWGKKRAVKIFLQLWLGRKEI